jgi:kynureninase
VIDVPNGYAITQSLLERQIIVDYRPNAGIRVAPHFYTTEAEVDAAIDAIDAQTAR